MTIGPVSYPILGKGGHRTMIPIEFLEDYLIDQEGGLKKRWSKSMQNHINELIPERLIEMATKRDL
jgi:hypothetical protein